MTETTESTKSNNSQCDKILNRENSIENCQRRMSSIELASENQSSKYNSFNHEIEKLQALSKTDLNKLNQKSSSNVNLSEHDGIASTIKSSENPCRETYSLYMFSPKNR